MHSSFQILGNGVRCSAWAVRRGHLVKDKAEVWTTNDETVVHRSPLA